MASAVPQEPAPSTAIGTPADRTLISASPVRRARSAGEAIDDYVPAFLRARASARRVEKIKARDLRLEPPDQT